MLLLGSTLQNQVQTDWQTYIDCHLLIILIIGYYGYRQCKQADNISDEYILGGRNIGPYITALSAGASDMRAGFMGLQVLSIALDLPLFG